VKTCRRGGRVRPAGFAAQQARASATTDLPAPSLCDAGAMRAAVLQTVPGELLLEDVTVDAPMADEVLVRTAASGLCHSDLHFMEGKYRIDTPVVLGHEAAGVVEAVGANVTYVAPGDHVITCLSMFCGRCEYCLSGRPHLCDRVGLERGAGDPPRISLRGSACGRFAGLGSFAEQMLVHEHAVVKIRDDMPLDRAALIGCGVTTGVGAVFRTAQVPPGSTVAVIGCGGVGLNCVQGAVLAGASRVVAVDTNAFKLEMARKFGATDVVDASISDPVAEVRTLFPGVGSGAGVEYAFEAIGLKQTAEQAFAMVRKGGTATVIGMIPVGVKIELDGSELLNEKRLQGSSMGSNRFRQDMPHYVDLYLGGRLKLDELVTARIELADVNSGFAAMNRGEVARSVVIFD
jgi:S-(hydroxymethyl)glutathione dehydrogenase/alcohol dehydrogenase